MFAPLVIAAALAAQGPTGAPAITTTAPATKATAPGAQMVCKTEPITGQRISRRTCHTKAEWEQMADNSKQYVSDLRRGQSRCPDPTMC